MATKMQKILLYVFGAMFLIPEVLWGNIIKILNFPFIPIYRDVAIFTNKPIVAFIIILFEIFGVGGIIYLLNKRNNIKISVKIILNIFLGIIFIILILSFYLSFVITKISFF